MQYEHGSEKISASPMPMSPTVNNQDYRQNGDIRRTRRIVLILLAISLVRTSRLYVSCENSRHLLLSLGHITFPFHRTHHNALSLL